MQVIEPYIEGLINYDVKFQLRYWEDVGSTTNLSIAQSVVAITNSSSMRVDH